MRSWLPIPAAIAVIATLLACGCDPRQPSAKSPLGSPANETPLNTKTPETTSEVDKLEGLKNDQGEGYGVMLFRVNIPAQHHLYRNFDSQNLQSKLELDALIDDVQAQLPSQSPHDSFQSAALEELNKSLQNTPIDFKTSTLLLLRNTQGSGSVRVWVETPRVVADELIFKVARNHPQMQTADMAYYCYAYVVPRDLAKQIRIVGAYTPARRTVREDGSQFVRPQNSDDTVFPLTDKADAMQQ